MAAAALPDGYRALMEACWAGNPHGRPDFAQVLAALNGIDAATAGGAGGVGQSSDAESFAASSDASQSRSL